MEDLELASQHEERYTKTLVELHGRRTKARPEYNETGKKICTECGYQIPTLRAAIEWVTTCIPCQQEIENANT